jgi:hypothetical protein
MAVTPNSIVTPQTPIGATAVATTANTTYTDTPTNSVQLLAAQTNGARIQKVTALARATVTATELQLYVSADGGTTKRFIGSKLMAAYTVAATTAQTVIDFGYTDAAPLILSSAESLWVAIGVTNTGIVFRAEGYAY